MAAAAAPVVEGGYCLVMLGQVEEFEQGGDGVHGVSCSGGVDYGAAVGAFSKDSYGESLLS